ncbi:uncharacterized protein LOC108460077 isoform X3 [Gossypium arboreum]|uniref:uncharacterized protein LOC108460077 isoform X3 n=1 Tax=Gossypium arboreum TaxID=29729 RepID=UPI0022F183BF|nr:uncharacterized protein LOC108460077 isoform X3 [Gossypium arboreum]
MNGNAYGSHYYDSLEESNLRKVDSQISMKLGLNAMNSFQESSCNRNADDGSWYIEAGDSKPKCFFHENKLRCSSSSMNLIGFFNNLWGGRVPSSYTKRLKDGEEEHSPLHIDASHAAQGQHIGLCSTLKDHGLQGLHGFLTKVMHLRRRLGACNARFDRFSYLVKVNQRSIKMILAIVFVFTLLGKCTICTYHLLFDLLYLSLLNSNLIFLIFNFILFIVDNTSLDSLFKSNSVTSPKLLTCCSILLILLYNLLKYIEVISIKLLNPLLKV